MRILLVFLTFIFATELEVDGNLKVTGNIDAQNNPIKNVGIPTDLTDAINGNVLQDALRDDGNYEYIFFYVQMSLAGNNGYQQYIYRAGYKRLDDDDFQSGSSYLLNPIGDFHNEITLLMNDSWKLDSINGAGENSWWIFKRPIEE